MATAYPGGSRPFTPFVYTQNIQTGAELYFPDEGLEASYRGFKFGKESGFQLYYIICPPGKLLPAELSGRYSKIVLLQGAVDKWLEEHPMPAEATLPDVPPPPPPKRSHHKKSEEPQAVEPMPMRESPSIFRGHDDSRAASARALMESRYLNSPE